MSIANQIIGQFQDLANQEESINLSRFFKCGNGEYGEGDIFLGIKVPQTRKLVKQYYNQLSFQDLGILVTSKYHEIRLFALLSLVALYDKSKSPIFKEKCINFYLSHTKYINNWDLVDLSCYKLLGNWIYDKERTILYSLAKSGYLWEERIAIVSCITLVKRGDFKECINISEILINHPHDLIHKAIGWILREMGKVDKNALIDFLSTHYNKLHRTSLRYAIERFPEEERQLWLRK